MASKGQMTGMQGVYLVAAELTRLGFIVSVTSRNARGIDLFATDQSYKKTWSVQVKTSWKPVSSWPLGKHYKTDSSNNLIYVFVNLRGAEKPNYYVVPSKKVAKEGKTFSRPKGPWHGFKRGDLKPNNWSVLGNPNST